MATDQAGTIRVLVVDDHAVVRHGLSTFLDGERDIQIVGEADGGQRAVELLEQLDTAGVRPHVVLMDLEMAPLDGIESTREIRLRYDDVEVVVLTSFGEPERVRDALAAGASGYLLKDADVDRIAAAVRAARSGEIQLNAAAARAALTAPEPESADDDPELTEREEEVLLLLGEGYANKAIAYRHGITERTTRTHVSSILAKLGLSSRTQAALWAARHDDRVSRQQPPSVS